MRSKLMFVALCGSVVTIGLGHYFVENIIPQLQAKTEIDDAVLYESHFRPHPITASNTTRKRRRRRRRRNARSDPGELNARKGERADDYSSSRFPIRTHIVTQGEPRTATTLLFNMVGVSYFLYLFENEPEKIPDVQLKYYKRHDGRKVMRKSMSPYIFKTHSDLGYYLSENAVVFAAAENRNEAVEMRKTLEKDGHTVAFVQDMETLKEDGLASLVDVYVAGYGLSEKYRSSLNDYFSKWEILRQCCGKQMSMKWRNEMMPEKYKIPSIASSHPICSSIDIDGVEQAFMKTELYSLIEEYPSVRGLNKASLKDGSLNGTYCSSYNYLVRTQGLSFWGTPGGRPSRTKLDGAIKSQLKLGKKNLKPEAYHLLPPSDKPMNKLMSEWMRRTTEEKMSWLKAILAARESGVTLSDYGIETTSSKDGTIDGFYSGQDNTPDVSELSDVLNDKEPEHIGAEGIAQDNHLEAHHRQFDDTRAIFLISFGDEAAKSSLVERCILSLRRRGAWDGYVVLLTDAPQERYENVWDENVIVMHPLGKHLKAPDGSPLEFTENNFSLKSKRFKTFIIDYIGMDKRLDSVRLIYYLDIDIMAGGALADLFIGLESKYDVSLEERDGGLSKLYFFTPLSEEWPLQGGTFIVERMSSRYCLELWRKEIDEMTLSGRGRDQDGLRNIYQLVQSGKETTCELIKMDNDNFISFPIPRTFDKISRQSNFPNLIHISNSVFAKWIDEEAQTDYIHKVLQLSEEEKLSNKYGKVIINPKKSDMKR
ncbi:hypothetical protein ACHAXA_006531 [Cyclostephanos tholiformis]|uniref:Uncharacterized protein n=1 Tax=Cyclostephanos tholiformis TaxID=382380 RepID=A0ABD3R228_9STRA